MASLCSLKGVTSSSLRVNSSHQKHHSTSHHLNTTLCFRTNGTHESKKPSPSFESFTRGELITGNSFLSSYSAKGFALSLGGSKTFHFFNVVQFQQNCFSLEGRRRRSMSSPRASFLGVGAPEALVIGVVALIVFGPKGLAEVAKNLGNTLRAFQPTIKELQQVSQEFRNTLEQEIGLDEMKSNQYQNQFNRNSTLPPPTSTPASPSPSPSPLSPPLNANDPPATFPETLSSPSPPPPSLAPPAAPVPATADTASPPPSSSPSSSSSSDPASVQAKDGDLTQGYSSEDYLRITQEQLNAMVPDDVRRASELAAWGGLAPVDAKINTKAPADSPIAPKTVQEKPNEEKN